MTLREDISSDVNLFATSAWGAIPNARVIPGPEDLTFGNSGERLDVTILYADVHRSTQMVDEIPDTLAAEYYKAFLRTCARIVRANEGEIQAYDGDRIMAIYTGDNQAGNAVRTGMQIFCGVREIINPAFLDAKGAAHRLLQHTVGIDKGQVLAAKTGVRVDSDLVWVGPAANYAAKLNSFEGLDIDYPTRITKRVFDSLGDTHKTTTDGRPIWEGPYNNMKTVDHYRTSFWWTLP